ncbi:MAG: iron-sulfur cluster assembly scaffold protein [Clostridia bacterium]|nr:iron-sulfur cluster assembly scaffold protein [Clostridia bacterium]
MISNAVLNVFNNPKNTGRISKPDGIADCFNADNTAHVEFSLRIESGIITNCQFRAQANPYIIAICSTITNMVKGKMWAMVFLDPYSIKKELGDESDIDITFCIDCLKLALDDYKDKLSKTIKESEKEIKLENKPIIDEIETKEEAPNDSDADDDFDFDDFFDDEDI